jgi:hypothetical protein
VLHGNAASQVCDELMNIELRQVEKFEALVDEFENRLNELKTEALEGQQLFFRSIEDLEEKFSSGRCLECACVANRVESCCVKGRRLVLLIRATAVACSIFSCARNSSALPTWEC